MFISNKKALKKQILNYRDKSFDNSKYVKKFYVENGKAYIECYIRSLEDIFSYYSYPDYDYLNPEFVSYIESNAYYIPLTYPLVIKMRGYRFTEEEKKQVQKVIRDHFGLKLGDKQIDLSNNSRKAFVLLMMAFVSFIFTLVLLKSNVISAFSEWIMIIFWFFAWECADVLILDRSDIRIQKLDAAQLASVKIVFEEEN